MCFAALRMRILNDKFEKTFDLKKAKIMEFLEKLMNCQKMAKIKVATLERRGAFTGILQT